MARDRNKSDSATFQRLYNKCVAKSRSKRLRGKGKAPDGAPRYAVLSRTCDTRTKPAGNHADEASRNESGVPAR